MCVLKDTNVHIYMCVYVCRKKRARKREREGGSKEGVSSGG